MALCSRDLLTTCSRNDTFELEIPRKLTQDEIKVFTVESELPLVSDRIVDLRLLQPDQAGELHIPLQPSKTPGGLTGDPMLVIRSAGYDQTVAGLSSFLYVAEVSNGQSSEVFEVRATIQWSSQEIKGNNSESSNAKLTRKVSPRHCKTALMFETYCRLVSV